MAKVARSTSATDRDFEIARAFIPVLIEWAREFITQYRNRPNEWSKSYSDLLNEAKLREPENTYLQTANPRSVGRRLGTIRRYRGELPDLSCLVINKATGDCGESYKKQYDPVLKRQEILDLPENYDWMKFTAQYENRIAYEINNVLPKNRKLVDSATKDMSDHYMKNKDRYPKAIVKFRDVIIKLIMDGSSPKEAFEYVIEREKL